MKSLPARPALAAFVLLLACVLPVHAQLPRPQATPPRVPITAVDARTGVVTARTSQGSRSFRFQVDDRSLLLTLKAGSQVWADFVSGKVRIHGGTPCCSIVDPRN